MIKMFGYAAEQHSMNETFKNFFLYLILLFVLYVFYV